MAADWTSRTRQTGAIGFAEQPVPYRQELLPGRCRHCRRPVVFVRLIKGTNHKVHGVLSLLTGGLWVPMWILAFCCWDTSRWECAECGRQRR